MDYEEKYLNGNSISMDLSKKEATAIIDQYGCDGACGYMGCEHELAQMELAQTYAYILREKEVQGNGKNC